jgi:hypothetical protein
VNEDHAPATAMEVTETSAAVHDTEVPEVQPMLDVHPAHHAANSWKEFLTHIATIVLGLCIAVGIEQTVEYFHHRHQIIRTREALRAERRSNHQRFFVQTEEFHRFVPILQTNLAIFQYLKKHPAAPSEQWPGKLDWYLLTPIYSDTAWRTAQQTNVLELMPDGEVSNTAFLYLRLARLSDAIAAEGESVHDAAAYSIQDPDPTHLSPAQLDRQIDLTTHALLRFANSAFAQRNLIRNFPDFPPTTTIEDESRIWRTSPSPEFTKSFTEMNDDAARFEKAHESSSSRPNPDEVRPAPPSR